MIKYITGNLFEHLPKDKDIIIAHVCNDKKVWGSGFVIPIKKKWPLSEHYHYNHRKQELGETQFHQVEDTIALANMIAQDGFPSIDKPCALDYDALYKCMKEVQENVLFEDEEIYAPKFGSKRSGGDWSIIEEFVNELWINNNIPVTIFEYEEK